MMPSSVQIGERIAQCRKQRGLTQAQLGEQLGLARTTVVAMEKGERPPNAEELVLLSKVLSISVNALIREHTVLAEASPRFRSAPAARRVHQGGFDQSVDQLKALGRQYAELERILSVPRIPARLESQNAYHFARFPAGMDVKLAGQDAADSLRRDMALGNGPALEIEERLELEAGLRIFHLALPSELAAILLWSDELGACVALNRLHPPERQRWSLVHELGHFLRDREAGDLMPARPLEGRRDASEQFCDELTKEFLLPASGVRRRFAEYMRDNREAHFSAADLLAMARFYDVSFQAMTSRLEELGLLPKGTLEKLRLRRFRPDAARRELGLDRSRETRPPTWLPKRYVRLALEAYSQELLSEAELATYLNTDRITARGVFLEYRTARAEEGEGGFELDLGENVFDAPPMAP